MDFDQKPINIPAQTYWLIHFFFVLFGLLVTQSITSHIGINRMMSVQLGLIIYYAFITGLLYVVLKLKDQSYWNDLHSVILLGLTLVYLSVDIIFCLVVLM